jgi:hypothetical protein
VLSLRQVGGAAEERANRERGRDIKHKMCTKTGVGQKDSLNFADLITGN